MKKFSSRFSTLFLLLSIFFFIVGSHEAQSAGNESNPCATDTAGTTGPTTQACFDYCGNSKFGNLIPECDDLCTKNPTNTVCLNYCSSLNQNDTVCEKEYVDVCKESNSFECLSYCGNLNNQINEYCSALCAENSANYGCQLYCSNVFKYDSNCDKFCRGKNKLSLTCSSYCTFIGNIPKNLTNSACADFCNDTEDSQSLSICDGYCIASAINNPLSPGANCNKICENEPESFACMYYNGILAKFPNQTK